MNSQWMIHWKLLKQELVSACRNTSGGFYRCFKPRLLSKLETMYVYSKYRDALEKEMTFDTDRETKRAHICALLQLWVQSYQMREDNGIQKHWMKLWTDTLFKYGISLKDEICELREWLLEKGLFVSFRHTWSSVLGTYSDFLQKQIEQRHSVLNVSYQHCVKKIVNMWNQNLSLIHPITYCWKNSYKWNTIPVERIQTMRTMIEHSENVIGDPVIQTALQQMHRPILLPFMHLKNKYISQQVSLGKKLLQIGIVLQTEVRECVANRFLMNTSSNILQTFKDNNGYFVRNSSYSDLYRSQIEQMRGQFNESAKSYKISHSYLASLLESDEWFNLLLWFTNIAYNTNWMSNSLLQNLGFILIPHRRIQYVSYKKRVPSHVVDVITRLFGKALKNKWGNITHHSSILLFLANGDLTFSKQSYRNYICEKYWLEDNRFCQPTHPVWGTTQTYGTNRRVSFHMMKFGWYPQRTMANLCHVIVHELNSMCEHYNRYKIQNDYLNNRPTIINIQSKLGLNTSRNNHRNVDSMVSAILTHFTPKVLQIYGMQDFFIQTIYWLSKAPHIPTISVLELQEAIMKMWDLINTEFDLTEMTFEILNLKKMKLILLRNPAWVVPLKTSSLPKETLEWWELTPLESTEASDVSIDAITQLPIDVAVTLPSGQIVDRSTYSLLLQSTGKDPFTMVPLPPLSPLPE